MAPILLRGGTVVRCDPAFTVEKADVLVQGDLILEIGADLSQRAPDATVLSCEGAAVLPGWVQTHIHLCQTLWRNQADDLELLDWLRSQVWPYEAALEAEDLYAAARLGALELLLSGTTCILDMGTVHHHDAVFEALAESGLRAASGKCLMDQGDGVPERLLQTADQGLKESLDLYHRWHGAEGGRLQYSFAPRFALACSEGLLREAGQEAQRLGVPLHTHASENNTECALVRENAGGRDNVHYLADLGIAGPGAVLAHCVHLSESEVEELASAGTRAVHCPSSNLKLASGIARVPETQAAGVHWSLGADGAPCNNRLDAFTEVRLAALLHKPRLGPRTMNAAQVLRLATAAGGEALGFGDSVGVMRPGAKADLQVVDVNGPHAGPGGAVAAALVYACRGSDVRHVLVGGQQVVQDGRCLSLDEAHVRAEARAALERVRSRLGVT